MLFDIPCVVVLFSLFHHLWRAHAESQRLHHFCEQQRSLIFGDMK